MTEMARIKRNPAAVKIAEDILREFEPGSVEDMQGALKEIFGPMFEAMLKGELNNHLGYERNSKNPKETSNRRNGTSPKTLKTTMGEVPISATRDRDGSFEPQIIPKRTKDVSAIEGKVLSMYAKGMSQRDISATIEDIYGFKVSSEMISDITDTILPEVEQLYDYGSAVRKVMYTTNAIEAINSSFRKVTKKGSFPNENAVYKLLYLRSTELQKKWDGGSQQNWALVLNQLMVNDKFSPRIEEYLVY